MREIIIKRFESKTDIEDSEHIYLICQSFVYLDKFIGVAKRMRPDRITIEYEEYLRRS